MPDRCVDCGRFVSLADRDSRRWIEYETDGMDGYQAKDDDVVAQFCRCGACMRRQRETNECAWV